MSNDKKDIDLDFLDALAKSPITKHIQYPLLHLVEGGCYYKDGENIKFSKEGEFSLGYSANTHECDFIKIPFVLYQVQYYTDAGAIYYCGDSMDDTRLAKNGTFEKEFNEKSQKWNLISLNK